jgi:hypothetical protein
MDAHFEAVLASLPVGSGPEHARVIDNGTMTIRGRTPGDEDPWKAMLSRCVSTLASLTDIGWPARCCPPVIGRFGLTPIMRFTSVW